jgi:hypothetical protein
MVSGVANGAAVWTGGCEKARTRDTHQTEEEGSAALATFPLCACRGGVAATLA